MITILSDIGGVILTNGWDSHARHKASLLFELDKDELDHRHDLYFPILELGKISLDDYLTAIIFYKKRPFSKEEFMEFLHNQSQLLPEMRDIFIDLKKNQGVRIFSLSNECIELAEWRYTKFHLDKVFDAYIVSGIVGMRKPDPTIYKLALALAQKKGNEVIYIDDRPYLVEAAQKLGITSWHHTTAVSTLQYLEQALTNTIQRKGAKTQREN